HVPRGSNGPFSREDARRNSVLPFRRATNSLCASALPKFQGTPFTEAGPRRWACITDERWEASSRFTRVVRRTWTALFSIHTRAADWKSSFSEESSSPPRSDRAHVQGGVDVDRNRKSDQIPVSETASYSNPGQRTAVWVPNLTTTRPPRTETWTPSCSKEESPAFSIRAGISP